VGVSSHHNTASTKEKTATALASAVSVQRVCCCVHSSMHVGGAAARLALLLEVLR
jgi:hypothetical protein